MKNSKSSLDSFQVQVQTESYIYEIRKKGRRRGREGWRKRGREGKRASKNLKCIMRKRTSKKPFNFVFCGPSPAGSGACH